MTTFLVLNEFKVLAQSPLVSIEGCSNINFSSLEDSGGSNRGLDVIAAKVATLNTCVPGTILNILCLFTVFS